MILKFDEDEDDDGDGTDDDDADDDEDGLVPRQDDLEIWMGMRTMMVMVMMILSPGNSAASKVAEGQTFPFLSYLLYLLHQDQVGFEFDLFS